MSKIADAIIKRIEQSTNVSFTKEMIIEIINDVKGGNQIIKSGDITLNLNGCTIKIGDAEPIKMQIMLFKVLVYLSDKEGEYAKKEELLKHVWGNDVIVGIRTVDVAVHKVKEIIGKHRITTQRKVGYMFTSQN